MLNSVKSNSSAGTWYNVSWYSQYGAQNGECVFVPEDESYDPYSYIEHYMLNTYGDEYGGIADYIETDDPDDSSLWDFGYQPIISSVSEEEQLNQAILDGRPFDLDTFRKYKVDPYRAKGAVKADVLEIGDIIQVTEDASEIDCPSPEIEITNIRYDDPDGYGHDCITFYCNDNETGSEYTLHFWPDEWVGPIIAKKSQYASVKSSRAISSMRWGERWRPYSGSDSSYQTLYVDGTEVGYIESYEIDGAPECIAYLKADPNEYEESLGTFRTEAAAKQRLEQEVARASELIERFPVTSASEIKRYSDVRPYEDRKYWYFTTHGVGPGTIPSDLNVLEVREGQNDKGTWGDFVCLDGVLNTDELSYYDLKELAPSDINSAENIYDDEDEWNPYHGHNYMVCAGPYNDLIFHCDDPKRAITYWFKYQRKYPTDVAIMCPSKELAMKLVKAGTSKLLNELYDKFDCPYKLDWLIAECKRKAEDGCRGFYEGKYGYGDSVHPFGVG